VRSEEDVRPHFGLCLDLSMEQFRPNVPHEHVDPSKCDRWLHRLDP
jgi:hypothetical protein